MVEYKIDVMRELAERGYTASRMRKERILGESTIQRLRRGESISTDTLNTICIILRKQPDDEKIKYF